VLSAPRRDKAPRLVYQERCAKLCDAARVCRKPLDFVRRAGHWAAQGSGRSHFLAADAGPRDPRRPPSEPEPRRPAAEAPRPHPAPRACARVPRARRHGLGRDRPAIRRLRQASTSNRSPPTDDRVPGPQAAP